MGNVFVADLYSPQLLVFNDIEFNSKFPPTGQHSSLKKPLAVAITKDRIYVIDAGDSKVKIFNPTGKLLLTFGGQGFKQGEFRFANGIAVDKSGKIYVADTGNARVQVFDPKGKLLMAFDGRPQIRFTFPRGIAVDPWQRIHIVDTFDKQVYVFNNKGRYLFSYGSGAGESDNESFSFPSGIAIDQKTGRIFIADRANNRLSIWDYPN
jgi:DNA-binding beta-propeller fold protein YncE